MSGGMEEAAEWEEAKGSVAFITSTALVVQDLKIREKFGFKKYGKYLHKHTDEDMLQHLYEELLDGAVYIKTLIEQRKK